MRLEGRVALVTGAGSGIGRAVALRFAGEGARVALLDKADEAVLEAVAEEIGDAGGPRPQPRRRRERCGGGGCRRRPRGAGDRCGRHRGQRRRHLARKPGDGERSRRLRPHHRHQPERHLPRLSGRGARHGRSRRRPHRQRRLGGGRDRARAVFGLRGEQGGRDPAHPFARHRARRPRESTSTRSRRATCARR